MARARTSLVALVALLALEPGRPALAAEQVGEAATVEKLTLEQKVGQLMMVGFGGTEVNADVKALLTGMKVGGVCLFKRNIQSAEQVAALNADILEALEGEIPPFIAVDQEGGNVVRLEKGAVVLPGNMALGATRSKKLAYEAGFRQGEALKLLGFNMNLAPVLDINVNPKNPVIGIRSFGDSPQLVSELGMEFVRGQQEANITTVAKHFPGHGNTDADSHRALPVMRETEKQLMEQIVPFSQVIHQGLDGLMTAHVAIPKVSGNDLPATLSPQILGTLLRKRMKFNGLVLTDELEMEAIAQRYGVGRAAVMAIAAGADMVLIPWRPEKKVEVRKALLEAARSGEITPARLNEAVERVLTAKRSRGVFTPPPPLDERLELLAKLNREEIPRSIAKQSVTLLRADASQFPIRAGLKVGVISAEPSFAAAVKRRAPNALVLNVPAYPSNKLRAELKAKAAALAANVDVVVVGLLNSRHVDLVTAASAGKKPLIVVALGLPYYAESVREARTVLAVYSYRDASTEAAVAAVFGETGTPGKLPVSLMHFPFGHGLSKFSEKDAVPTAIATPD